GLRKGIRSVRVGCKEESWLAEFQQFRALGQVAAAPAQLGPVLQDDFVFAVKPRKKLADGVQPDQAAAVDAHELLRVERILDGVEGGANRVLLSCGMDEDVVAIGFDPGDLPRRDKKGAGVFANQQAIGILPPPVPPLQQVVEPGRQAAFAAGMLRLRTAERLAEALFGNRFEQIVESIDFKSAQSVLIVRGDENKLWQPVEVGRCRDALHDVETVG